MEDIDSSFNLPINKKRIIELLEKILRCSIKDIAFEGKEQLDGIIEYDFSLIKTNIVYNNKKSDDIFIKIIKGGKIKETIFCYWSLLYDEYLKKNKAEEGNNLQKAVITQITSDDTISHLLLTLNSKLNYYAEIDLVELKNFTQKNKLYERWSKDLEIKSGDILFIGKKMY